MKQEINFLQVYQCSQPRFSGKHILWVWLSSSIFMCAWMICVFYQDSIERSRLMEQKKQNRRSVAELQAISNQFSNEHGQSLAASMKVLTQQINSKKQLIKTVHDLRGQEKDLTYYVRKIADDYEEGTLIDFVSIKKGEGIKIVGRSVSPQIIPKVLSSWEGESFSSKRNTHQLDIHNINAGKGYVKFIIQVQ